MEFKGICAMEITLTPHLTLTSIPQVKGTLRTPTNSGNANTMP